MAVTQRERERRPDLTDEDWDELMELLREKRSGVRLPGEGLGEPFDFEAAEWDEITESEKRRIVRGLAAELAVVRGERDQSNSGRDQLERALGRALPGEDETLRWQGANGLSERCPTCVGEGWVAETVAGPMPHVEPGNCPDCDGTGAVRAGEGEEPRPPICTEPDCAETDPRHLHGWGLAEEPRAPQPDLLDVVRSIPALRLTGAQMDSIEPTPDSAAQFSMDYDEYDDFVPLTILEAALRAAPVPASGPTGTICKCGSAKIYHRPEDRRDHEYEPRYPVLASGLPSREDMARAICSNFDMTHHDHEAFLQPDSCEQGLTDADAILATLREETTP